MAKLTYPEAELAYTSAVSRIDYDGKAWDADDV